MSKANDDKAHDVAGMDEATKVASDIVDVARKRCLAARKKADRSRDVCCKAARKMAEEADAHEATYKAADAAYEAAYEAAYTAALARSAMNE